MKKKLLLLLLSCPLIIFGQDFEMNFLNGDEAVPVDSVTACNLSTGESVTFPGDEILFLSLGTGILNPNNIGFELNAYPNPSNGNTHLNVSVPNEGLLNIKVRNQLGQIVCEESKQMGPGTHSYQVSLGTAGLYHVEVQHPEGKRFINLISTNEDIIPNDIRFLGQSLETIRKSGLKAMDNENILSFNLGDEIRYTFYGGIHSTIIQDKPQGSKAFKVVFPVCIDADGRSYQTVTIGDQVWMAENLAYLPEVSPPDVLSNETAHYYVYGSSTEDVDIAKTSENYKKFGVLYNWDAAMISCPEGWHLPADAEWESLEGEMGMNSLEQHSGGWRYSGDVGKKLKSCTGWFEDGCGTNACGLDLIPAGWIADDECEEIETSFVSWTSSYINTQTAYHRWVNYAEDGIYKAAPYRRYGQSVRCIKD